MITPRCGNSREKNSSISIASGRRKTNKRQKVGHRTDPRTENRGPRSNQPVIQVPLKLRRPDVPDSASVSSHAVLLPPSSRPTTAASEVGRQRQKQRPRPATSSDLSSMSLIFHLSRRERSEVRNETHGDTAKKQLNWNPKSITITQ